MRRYLAAVLLAACATDTAGTGGAGMTDVPSITASRADADVLARFTPRPSRTATINYDLIDEALDVIVFNGGPSRRERAGQPDAFVGTRIVKGHEGPYRLEGNKVFFSLFDDETRASIHEYRVGLEAVARNTDITTLGRNEQLAYWLNLHNMAVIDEIAQAYPVRRPGRMRPSGGEALLHDAKVIDLGEAGRLSLRDVREIVYAHWSDPDAIYGLFRGDIGGPRIRSEAYRGSDLRRQLDSQAREFVNALRGTQVRGHTLLVSPIYAEVAPRAFADLHADLSAHLDEHAEGPLRDEIQATRAVAFVQYDETVADLAGGDTTSNLNFNGNTLPTDAAGGTVPSRAEHEQNAMDWDSRIPPQVRRIIQEYEEKVQRLQQDGLLTPRIVIEDVPTDDPDEVD